MPRLEIELLGHLLVGGGKTAGLGVDQATARRYHRGQFVPYIPATALRGAVRIQLESLLQGAARDATDPYPFDRGPEEVGNGKDRGVSASLPEVVPDDLVARLFGFSGPQGERTFAKEGCLRFGDALPRDPDKALQALGVRPGVELDDDRRTAADQKLYFREVADRAPEPLLFEAELLTGDASEDDLRALRAAVETTAAIGAAKAAGGGEVSIRWLESDPQTTTRVRGEPATARRARLTLTLVEPAHFGDGGPQGNHHATRTFVPGSTVRGAVAWALLRAGKVVPEAPAFRSLFLDASDPVSFGDGVPAEGEEPAPRIRPRTLRRPRGAPDGERVDLLVPELARERVNRRLREDDSPLYLRSMEATRRLEALSARPSETLLLRTRTRVSIDRERGTAKDGKLFSIEQIEPWRLAGSGDEEPRPVPVRLVSWVENLRPDAARLLAALEGVPVFLGAGRNHGMGRVEVEVDFEAKEPEGASEAGRVEELAAAVAAEADRLARAAGLGPRPENRDPLPLALVAQSSFVPTAEIPHPLAALAPQLGAPRREFLAADLSGGYDQRPARHRRESPEPLKTLQRAVAAGSVYVYEVAGAELPDLLGKLIPRLRRGVGGRVESGCGRFEVYQLPFEKGDPS